MASDEPVATKRVKVEQPEEQLLDENQGIYTFKVKLSNVPKFIHTGVLKKMLKALFSKDILGTSDGTIGTTKETEENKLETDIESTSVLAQFSCKKAPNSEYGFLGFTNAESRILALSLLQGWAIQKSAIQAVPIEERPQQLLNGTGSGWKAKEIEKRQQMEASRAILPEHEQVQDQCTPFWR